MNIRFFLFLFALVAIGRTQTCETNGLLGFYYLGNTAVGYYYNRIETPYFNPAALPALPPFIYTVRWNGFITFPSTGNYVLRMNIHGNSYLSINSTIYLDRYVNQLATVNTDSISISMTAGTKLPIFIEYNARFGSNYALRWSFNSGAFSLIPSSAFSVDQCTALVNGPSISSDLVSSSFNLQLTIPLPPTSPVTVNMISSHDVYTLSSCSAQFNSETFDVPQTIVVTSDPLRSINSGTITFNLSSADLRYHGKTFSIPISRTYVGASRGGAWTLGHLTTFDAARYEFNNLGDFYLLRQRNSELVIQVRKNQYGTLSGITAVAVKYRSTIFYVYIAANGLPFAWINNNGVAEGCYLQARNRDFIFTTGRRAVINIKLDQLASIEQNVLSIYVTLPPSLRSEVRGLLGNFDLNSANDLVLPNGAITVDQSAFQEAWKVDNVNNLFFSVFATIPTLPGASIYGPVPIFNVCGGSTPIVDQIGTPLAASSAILGFPNFLQSITFNPSFTPVNPTFANSSVQIAAQTACNLYLASSSFSTNCNTYISMSYYYDQCLVDYAYTSDSSLVSEAMNALSSECISNRTLASQTIPVYLLCPNFCSISGTCSVSGNPTCTCTTGFGMSDCGAMTSLKASTLGMSPTSSSPTCVTGITFHGRNFFPGLRPCSFAPYVGFSSTWVSKWQIICKVPSVTASFPITVGASIIRDDVNDGKTLNFTYIETCCDNPCAHGTCIGSDSEPFTCDCGPAWNGTRCDISTDLCRFTPCKNGANCTGFPGGYNCSCSSTQLLPLCATCTLNMTSFISIPESTGKGTFTVVLNGQPREPVIVSFDSDCASFSNCSVVFTPENWNIPVTITLTSNPNYPNTTCNLVAKMTGDAACNNKTQTSTISKLNPKLYCASGWGDPHYSTFDGIGYDYFGTGDYYLTKSLDGTFAIQARLSSCGHASCHSSVAIKFNSFVFYVEVNQLTGAIQVTSSGSAAAEGVHIVYSQNKYYITTPNGIRTLISPNYLRTQSTYFLDVQTCVPSTFNGQLVGLFGYFSGNRTDDYILPDGTLGSQSTWRTSWAAPLGQNLFVDPAATIPVTRPAFQYRITSNTTLAASNCNPVDPPFVPVVRPNNTNITIPDPKNETKCEDLPVALLNAGRNYCSPYFNDSTAQCCSSNGVSGNDFYRACVCDIAFTNDTQTAYSSVEAFYSTCNARLDLLNVNCNPCPSACNGQGSCSNGTCNCTTGYRGESCDEDWNTPPEVSSLVLSYCPFSILVSGFRFYGEVLYCKVGIEVVLGIKLSNSQVRCTPTIVPPPGVPVEVSIRREGVPVRVRRDETPVVLSEEIYSNNLTVTPILPCCENPCLNGANCTDTPQGYWCNCTGTGFVGPNCGDLPPTTQAPTTQPPTTQPPTTQPPTTQPPTTQPPTTQPPTTQPPTTQPPYCTLMSTPEIQVLSSGQNFTVTLGGQITSNVILNFTSDCAYTSVCTLTITPEMSGTPQIVTAFPNTNSPATRCRINITASGDSLCNGFVASTMVNKTNLNTWATAFSVGDPHITTFDKLYYDFFGVGDYYYLRETCSEFTIQARQGACASASCNYAVAIKYRSVVVYVYLTPGGIPALSVSGNAVAEGVLIVGAGLNAYNIILPNTVRVKVSVGLWASRNIYFLGIQTFLPTSFAGKVYGLSGYYDGNIANEFTMPNGTLTSNKDEFGESWAVPNMENLFLNENAVIPPFNCLPIGTPNPSCNTFSAANNLGSNLIGSGSPLRNAGVPRPNGTVADCSNPTLASRVYCARYFNDSLADCCRNKGVDSTPFYLSCLCDFTIAGHEFVYENVDAFYDTCKEAAITTNTAPCLLCPKACSGNGNCTRGVCVCNFPFRGVDCSEDWGQLPRVDSLQNPIQPRGCVNVITVLGQYFFGGLIICNFGNGVNVTAYKISNFQVRCGVPTVPWSQNTLTVHISRGSNRSETSTAITYVDSCCSRPCGTGRCLSAPNSINFTCNCTGTGFQGERCELDVNECLSSPCGSGVCINGANRFTCDCTGTGFTGPTCNWIQYCFEKTEFNAFWFRTLPGTNTTGICNSGFIGSPQRFCGLNGAFGSVINPCVPISGTCPSETYNRATWPATSAGLVANGTCTDGHTGSPVRQCRNNGTWADLVNNHCVLRNCTGFSQNGATFPTTSAFSTANGVCDSGLAGFPRANCTSAGTWTSVSGSCEIPGNCPALMYGRVNWPSTAPGTTSLGISCVAGWTFGNYGGIRPPERRCSSTGQWTTLINYHCVRI